MMKGLQAARRDRVPESVIDKLCHIARHRIG